MSIINQALQKAQREQLRHSPQEMPYRLPVQRSRAPRRWWLLGLLGLVAAVGMGATLHAWFLTPTGRVPVPIEHTVTSSPVVAASPPATPMVQSGPDTAPTEASPQPLPTVSEPLAPAPVVVSTDASTDATPVPPDSPAPPPAPAPNPPSAPVPLPRVVPPAAVAAVPAQPPAPLPSVTPPVASSPAEAARAQALMQRAAAAQEAKELTRALTLLEQAIKLDPTAKAAYNSLGNVYYQQRRYQQALAMYQKALALDPDYVQARTNLGNTYMQLAMHTRAIEELQKALQADSSYSLAYYNLACVYARSGNSATAAQYLQQAITLEPQARTWAQADADFMRVRTTPEVQRLLGP
jgi:outer membrane biosynthesis protein TonB